MLAQYRKFLWGIILSGGLIMLAACGGGVAPAEPAASGGNSEVQVEDEHNVETVRLTLPELTAVELDGQPLRVVATTSLIGDVVANIGGEMIALTTLMGPGVDPHSYEPSAADFTTVADADVIFINGWNLEEGLVDDLETAADGIPVVTISAGIEPLEFGESDHEHEGDEPDAGDDEEHERDEHEHSGADPHVWLSVHNVAQWAKNVEMVLHELDPTNEASYAANLDSYLAQLEALESDIEAQLATIPAENRKLVTNHDSFGYLAAEYDFEVIGTVIPAASTVAEPSARDLADLIEEMNEEAVCTIFTENTVSDQLANTVAAELADCETVQVLPLFTGGLGPEGSTAESYIEFMRTNIDTIVQGLGG